MTELADGQVRVALTIAELKVAVGFGLERALNGIGRKPRWPYAPGGLWRAHIMGAIGEAVVAKHTGWKWAKDVHQFRSAPDVGGVEVRWSGDEPPMLKVRHDERGDERCVLVSGDVECGGFAIRGWLIAADAPFVKGVLCRELGGGKTDWLVPHQCLHPIAELVEIMKGVDTVPDRVGPATGSRSQSAAASRSGSLLGAGGRPSPFDGDIPW